jgi:hypothetical protein
VCSQQELVASIDSTAIKEFVSSIPQYISFGRLKELISFINHFVRDKLSSVAALLQPLLRRVVDGATPLRLTALLHQLLEHADSKKVKPMRLCKMLRTALCCVKTSKP